MQNFEKDPSRTGDQRVDQRINQPIQESTLSILSDSASNVSPDNSIGEISPTPDFTIVSNSNSSGIENRRRDGALKRSQKRLNMAKRIFGETEEEQRVNFEREYQKEGSLIRLAESLKKSGILLSKYRLRRVRNSLNIPKLRSKSPRNKPRVKEELRELVREARVKGLIDKLPTGMQKVLEQRYPAEGEPKALMGIGYDMGGITRERVRQKEVKALRRLRRLEEGKRQIESGPRDDIDVNEVIRLYTIEGNTKKEIASLMGCHYTTISSRLKAESVPIRKGRPRKR